jgi:carboxyl-terminal processing protease
LMLDLRDNPGGQVNEAACVLNLFVPRGQILFETRYLDPRIPSEIYRSENERVYDGSLAVLINAGSASAAEIVAGSLKDLGRATLVGERSFGKGSFQDGIMWPGSLKVAQFKTRGFYYFPSGWTPQLTGIEPDLAAGPSEDSVLREADLYFEPLRPKDLWNGPQSLAWLTNSACEPGATIADAASEDPQLETAEKLLTCRQAFQGF